jgi:hypothetical protein
MQQQQQQQQHIDRAKEARNGHVAAPPTTKISNCMPISAIVIQVLSLPQLCAVQSRLAETTVSV